MEEHENDILGYKDGNQYYQWAVLKIVGMDVPLVLDAMPRERGQSKDEIVEELLSHATEMITIDLLMLDREFDSEGVKDTCEEYGIYYLNPTRLFERSDEADTIEWMYREDKRFHITEKEPTTDDTTEFIHMIERIIRWYRHRWGIENGFKKQKHFMVRTTSTERNYRFFNFAFACVLYNVWRLVDLLVKLVLDGEYRSYEPRVDANQFLTVAKQFYDLDPPD